MTSPASGANAVKPRMRSLSAALAAWLAEQYRSDWVVYAKPPFGGPVQVLKYLARYTHRVIAKPTPEPKPSISPLMARMVPAGERVYCPAPEDSTRE